jgi:hypothetical protein
MMEQAFARSLSGGFVQPLAACPDAIELHGGGVNALVPPHAVFEKSAGGLLDCGFNKHLLKTLSWISVSQCYETFHFKPEVKHGLKNILKRIGEHP